MRRAALILSLLQFLSSPVQAENPWGPSCATLDECLTHLMKTPECAPNDYKCFWDVKRDGLGNEFEKFGRSAVPPLLELVGSDNATLAAKAVDLLWRHQDQVLPEERAIVLDAWRRGVYGSELLASSFATADFVKEVMRLLRANPVEEGRIWNTFTNFRDWGKQPNGVHATISEHIECSEGEPCEPRFARLQIDWLVSNRRSEDQITDRIMQAIDNPNLDTPGRLAALEFFRPNEYSRTQEQLEEVAVPFLRKMLNSADREAAAEAAHILAEFADQSVIEPLVAKAVDQAISSSARIRALHSLLRYERHDTPTLTRLGALLTDSDWDVRRHALVLHAAIDGDYAVDDVIGQIGPHDWLISYSAVSALRDMSTRKPELLFNRSRQTTGTR